MRKDLLNQLSAFEVFIDRFEAIIDEVKNLDKVKNGEVSIKEFDLRCNIRPNDPIIFPIPTTILEFLEIWHWVQACHANYLSSIDNDGTPDEIYLDVFWNDTETNTAHYINKTLWMFLKKDGVHYENEEKFDPRKYDGEIVAQNLIG